MPRVIQSVTNNKQESILVGCAPRTSVATTRYQYRVVIPSIPPTPLVYPPPSLVYPPTPSIPTCLVYPPNTPPHSWKGTGTRHTYSPRWDIEPDITTSKRDLGPGRHTPGKGRVTRHTHFPQLRWRAVIMQVTNKIDR